MDQSIYTRVHGEFSEPRGEMVVTTINIVQTRLTAGIDDEKDRDICSMEGVSTVVAAKISSAEAKLD